MSIIFCIFVLKLTSMSKILIYYNLRQFEFIGTYSIYIYGLPFYFLNYGNI